MAIPLARIGEAVHKYRSSLVPLSTLGGVGGGVNTFQYQWPLWIWRPAYHAGQPYAIGAETGPLALCYRPRLLAEAGLPSSPARLARYWSTWQGFLAFGREFNQRIPQGPAFMDSVTSMYDAMVSQAGPATTAPSGPAADPAVQRAWASAAKAAKDGLAAGLAPQTRAWDTGVTRLSFATTVCPPWLPGPIQRLSGRHGAGTWAVTAVPPTTNRTHHGQPHLSAPTPTPDHLSISPPIRRPSRPPPPHPVDAHAAAGESAAGEYRRGFHAVANGV